MSRSISFRKPEIKMARPDPNPKEVEIARMIGKAVGTRYFLSSRHELRTGSFLYRKGYIVGECHRFREIYRYTGKPVEEEYLVDENGSHLRDEEEWEVFFGQARREMDDLYVHYCLESRCSDEPYDWLVRQKHYTLIMDEYIAKQSKDQ